MEQLRLSLSGSLDGNSLDSALTAPFGHVSIQTQALCALKSLCTCVCQPPGLPFMLYSSCALKRERAALELSISHQGCVFLEEEPEVLGEGGLPGVPVEFGVPKPHTRLAVPGWVQEDCREIPASPSPA